MDRTIKITDSFDLPDYQERFIQGYKRNQLEDEYMNTIDEELDKIRNAMFKREGELLDAAEKEYEKSLQKNKKQDIDYDKVIKQLNKIIYDYINKYSK